ncbi:hypothetical protein F2Q68_00017113 [Brassica cretica]|uniref:Uncharacterized protein n=1 Tax=Brassica cretica TaxID=69181 RepID=A0A8S9HBQ8_BRACR|nr:hypothetical protein F2Q68_00017113 [Brassica cretica]
MADPAWPSAELDRFSLANGRAGHVVGPARRMAELVVWSIQAGQGLSDIDSVVTDFDPNNQSLDEAARASGSFTSACRPRAAARNRLHRFRRIVL